MPTQTYFGYLKKNFYSTLYYFCYIWLFWYSSLNKRYNWFKQKRKLLLWDLMMKQDSVEQYSNDDVSRWADDFCPFVAFLFNRWFVQTDDRKTIPSEFHWWSADPTQSSSHWVERTDCSFLPFFPSRNISDELNSTFRNLKKWETCFHILHLHHVFFSNGYVFFASSLCHVFMN